jgi:hypothetical protein
MMNCRKSPERLYASGFFRSFPFYCASSTLRSPYSMGGEQTMTERMVVLYVAQEITTLRS